MTAENRLTNWKDSGLSGQGVVRTVTGITLEPPCVVFRDLHQDKDVGLYKHTLVNLLQRVGFWKIKTQINLCL